MGLIVANHGYAWRYAPRWALSYLFQGKPVACARTLWYSLVRGHISEACEECGRPYLLWWADDALYERVTGRDKLPNGEAATGLFCFECFDTLAEGKGIRLKWVPEEIPGNTDCSGPDHDPCHDCTCGTSK
jgi:hypothetical protein